MRIFWWPYSSFYRDLQASEARPPQEETAESPSDATTVCTLEAQIAQLLAGQADVTFCPLLRASELTADVSEALSALPYGGSVENHRFEAAEGLSVANL